ncbi:MAG: dTDP-glucose 4,6-dehydratase [Planctomycetes bacterium]|nr:dTDP-glucose 4,6-dehydratase [Planctomycetota bacterium]
MRRERSTSVLVTGGAGFIGSNLVRYIGRHRPDWNIVNYDALTHAGNLGNLGTVAGRYTFVHGDVRDRETLRRALRGCTHVVHLAAETLVDRPLADDAPFITTNVHGTQTLLDACRETPTIERIVIGSTGRVYGPLPIDATRERSTERSPLRPSGPYAESKAAADSQALAHHRTFDTPVMIARSSTSFGPCQYPEETIPRFVTNLLDGWQVPLHGDGRGVRDWIHVIDNCEALLAVLERGEPGEVYNIGADNEHSLLELTHEILRLMDKPESMIRNVPDRPGHGHDHRYALDTTRIREELAWRPTRSAWPEALADTVAWYTANRGWWNKLTEAQARLAA